MLRDRKNVAKEKNRGTCIATGEKAAFSFVEEWMVCRAWLRPK